MVRSRWWIVAYAYSKFASAHGLEMFAEGVETEAELLTLRSIGVPYVQGYLLGRPESHWVEPLAPALRLADLPETIEVDRHGQDFLTRRSAS